MARTKLQTPNFSLTKRSDGYYVIRYEQDGETKTKATGTKNATEAEAARARFVASYTAPKLGARATVESVCDVYMQRRQEVIADAKRLPYSYNPIKRHLGGLYADALTQSVIDGYIETRENERPERKSSRWGDQPVSEATISKELRMLRAALNWAADERLIERRPTFRIELSTGDVRLRWITKDEAALLFNAASPHLALFIRIALSTAKRREAVLGLKWTGVDLTKPGYETLDFGADVGNKRKGSIPIGGNVKLIEMLKEAHKTAVTPYVIEYRGERVKDIKTALSAACKRAGIETISSHVLKHTAITWMIQGGMTFEKVAMLTNTSKEIVEKVYGHNSPSFLAEASQAVSF